MPEQWDRMSAYVPKNGLKQSVKSGIMKSSGEIKKADSYTSVDRKWNIDPTDKEKISDTVEYFASSFSSVEKEHSIVITKSGEVFSLTGTSVTVDPSVIGAEKLRGSIGAHNHPVRPGETMGDSFSRADLIFSAKYRTGIEYLISGSRRNAFKFLQEYTEEEIYRAWKEAFQTVRERALSGELIIEWEQEEILKVLAEQLEGFIFYENF